MTKVATTTTNKEFAAKVMELKTKIAEVRLNIRSGQEKNTNAHKPLRAELARLLTKKSI
jgi:ribosomal protein L29